SLAPEHLGRREPRRSAAHDHDSSGLLALGLTALSFVERLDLVAHKQLAVALFHAPAGHWIEGGRGNRLAWAHAERGVVPRGPDRVADNETLGERTAVVRAGRADGEEFLATARQEHGVISDMPGDHAAVGNITERDTLREVGPLRF